MRRFSANKKGALKLLVPRTGFEPVISAVRGRRPKPLDQRGIFSWSFNLGQYRRSGPSRQWAREISLSRQGSGRGGSTHNRGGGS